MKKHSLIRLSLSMALLLGASAPLAESAVIFSDAFNYPAGDLVANSGGVWTLDGTPTAGTNFAIKSTGWGSGNGVQSDPRETNIRAMHNVNLSAYANSTVYFSVLVDALPVPTDAPYFGDGDEGKRFVVMSLFGEATVGAALTERLYFGRASGDNANWGIYGAASGGNKFSTVTSDAFNGPKLLVLRVDFSSSAVDPARLYVLDPANIPGTEPTTADASTTPTEMGSVTSVRFGSGWSAASPTANPTSWGMFDNLGVFTQWNDLSAVNVPEPGSTLLLGASLAGLMLRRRRD